MADQVDEVEVETFWTPNQPWGNNIFRIEGDLFRMKRKREKEDCVIETEVGDAKMRKLSSGEEKALLHYLLESRLLRGGKASETWEET